MRDTIERHLHACSACREAIGHAVAIGEPRLDEKIGRFMVRSLLGSGGMGSVYAAFDPELQRDVAIKLLHTNVRDRLLREAQALAKIDHPNVIKVFDVGDHDGQIYIAMELADGGTLREWLATPRSLDDLLLAFAAAGRGLAAAHSAGLVHRDFKPDNVLRFARGRICVTDFGLVAVEHGDAKPASNPSLTVTGALLGTPAYMAPEQWKREPTSPATDQFAFCIALHEAVYGALPFPADSFHALERAVVAAVYTKPAKRVPAWLDALLRRGLAVDPAARWPSMDAIVATLSRDRRGRRRTVLVAAGAVAVGTALAIAPWRSTSFECSDGTDLVARVWNPAQFAAKSSAFALIAPRIDGWTATWKTDHLASCRDPVRLRCLDQRLAELGALVDTMPSAIDRAAEASLRLPSFGGCDGAPATPMAAQLLSRASAELALGHYPVARDLARALERTPEALRITADAEQRLLDPRAIPDYREAMRLARAAHATTTELGATVGLISALTARGKYEAAQELATLADATGALPEQALLLETARADLEIARGQPKAARERLERALAATKLSPDHLVVLTALERLGTAYKDEGKFAEARARYEQARAMREKLESPDHPDVASALDNLGTVSRVEGKLDEAQHLYERALAIRTAALGAEHPFVADSYNNLGTLALDRGDPTGAQRAWEHARDIYVRVYGADSVDLALELSNLGSSLVQIRAYPAASEALTRARAILEAKLGPTDYHVAYVVSELGVIAERTGRLDDALALIRQAREVATTALGAEHPDIADYLEREASVLSSQNKLADAEPLMARAIAIYRVGYGSDHPRVGLGLSALAQLQGLRGDYKSALATWQQVLPIYDRTLPADHPNRSFVLAGMADALTELDRPAEALPLLDRALAIRTERHMPAQLLAEIHAYYAYALIKTPDKARARREASTSLALYRQAGDADDAKELAGWLAAHR